jgi:hypothetical protein
MGASCYPQNTYPEPDRVVSHPSVDRFRGRENAGRVWAGSRDQCSSVKERNMDQLRSFRACRCSEKKQRTLQKLPAKVSVVRNVFEVPVILYQVIV